MAVFVMREPFCVIGVQCTNPAWNRKWYADPEQAEQHAVELLGRAKQKATELFVVQAIRLVRTPVNYEVLNVHHKEIS